MTIDSSSDLLSIIFAVVTGILLSLVYDVFKSIRNTFKSGVASVIIQDIIFSLLAAIITFLLLFIRVKGEIRWFVLISELLSFSLFRIYISKHIVFFLTTVILFIKRMIISPIIKLFLFIQNAANRFFDKIIVIFLKKNLKDKH